MSSPDDDLVDSNYSVSVCPSVHQQSFPDFHLIWCLGKPRRDMHSSLTLTAYNVKVRATELHAKTAEEIDLEKCNFRNFTSSLTLILDGVELTVVHICGQGLPTHQIRWTRSDFWYSCAAPDNIWTDLRHHTVPLQWCQVARFQHETAVFRRPLRPPVWEDLSPVFTFYLRCV